MTGSPEVIEMLLRLTRLSAEVHNALHDQEHAWEAAEYPKLEKVWDEANREVWDKVHHRFLKRLYDLGSSPSNVTRENVAQAYSRALEGFNSLHAECQRLYDLVEEDDDYVTEKLAMKVQKILESWINYFEAKLAQARTLDRSDFLAEQL